MTTPVEAAAARLAADVDQLDAEVRDRGRLLALLRPLAGARGPAWWTLRRLPPEQRAEAKALISRLELGR